MNKRRVASFALVCVFTLSLCLSLVSCGRSAVRISDAEAMPIQRVIDGLLENSTSQYRSAFPPVYDAAVEAMELMWKTEADMTFDGYLQAFRALAIDSCRENYGDDIGAEFIVESITAVDPASRPADFENYTDYIVFDYTFDTASLEKAVIVSGSLNVWGDDGEGSRHAEYISLMIDGVWYLHPMYYYFSLI